MRISSKAQAVLAAVEYAPDETLDVIEKRTGLRAHTVKYFVHQLLEQRVMRYYTVINAYRLGYTAYSVYLSLSSNNGVRAEELLASLCRESCVSWVAQVGGDYQLCVSVLARSMVELTEFLDRISATFSSIITERSIVTQVSLSFFPTKYVYRKPPVGLGFTWGQSNETVEVDDTDKKILSGLLQLNVPSQRELARRIGLAASTLQDRLHRLKKAGVIIGSLYLVNPEPLGMQSFKLLVSTRGPHSQVGTALLAFCQKHPNVTSFIHCLGGWDYEIGVEVPSSVDTLTFTSEISAQFPEVIARVRTIPMFRELKVACFPFSS